MKNKKPLNIIFLTISRVQDVEDSGIYTDLLREFRDEGHAVTIVSPIERKFKGDTKLIEKNGVHLLQVKTLNIQKTHFIEKGIGTILLEYQYIKAIKKHLSAVKFDLVLYATPPITLVKPVSFIKDRDGAFCYLMLKDIFPQNAVDLGFFSKKSLLYKLFRNKEKQLYKVSDYIGCMSPANVNYVLEYNLDVGPEKVGICPNALDLSRVPKYAPRVKSSDRPLRFIYGGNLGKPQGLDFLLEIIKVYINSKKIEFIIVGSGTEYPRLNTWFNEYKPSNAMLMSHLPKDEYEALVRDADVGLILLDRRFTIPNFPSRLLSYLQNGLPVFCAVDATTDVGKIAELNNFGFACLHGDLSQAIKIIDELLSLPYSQLEIMGKNGYKFLIGNYSVSGIYEKILSYV